MRFRFAVSAIAVFAFGVPALAHHSFSMFDSETTVMVDGTVSEFEYINPHAWLHLTAADANGREVEWSIEMGGINAISRVGWQEDTVKPGDRITIQIHPMKDGSRGGQYLSATLSDGRTLEGGDLGLPPIAR
jgi:hypothetical protein